MSLQEDLSRQVSPVTLWGWDVTKHPGRRVNESLTSLDWVFFTLLPYTPGGTLTGSPPSSGNFTVPTPSDTLSYLYAPGEGVVALLRDRTSRTRDCPCVARPTRPSVPTVVTKEETERKDQVPWLRR